MVEFLVATIDRSDIGIDRIDDEERYEEIERLAAWEKSMTQMLRPRNESLTLHASLQKHGRAQDDKRYPHLPELKLDQPLLSESTTTNIAPSTSSEWISCGISSPVYNIAHVDLGFLATLGCVWLAVLDTRWLTARSWLAVSRILVACSAEAAGWVSASTPGMSK